MHGHRDELREPQRRKHVAGLQHNGGQLGEKVLVQQHEWGDGRTGSRYVREVRVRKTAIHSAYIIIVHDNIQVYHWTIIYAGVRPFPPP